MALGSTTAKNKALDACYGTARAATWPATLYLALYAADPSTGGAEITGGGYARVAVANTDANWAAAASGSKANAATFSFPTSTGAYSATANYWALISTASGAGDLYDTAALSSPLSVTAAGITPQAVAGALVITTG